MVTYAVFDLNGTFLSSGVGTNKYQNSISNENSTQIQADNIQVEIAKYQTDKAKYQTNNLKRMNPETSLLRTASVSKLVTSMAVLKLVSEGHLDLNAKILDLKEVPFVEYLIKNETHERLKKWSQISVRDLMNHQAGISKDQSETLNGFFNSEALTRGSYASMDSFLPSLLKIKFLFEPKQIMKYSNMGPNLLARIVEAKNPLQLSFSQFVTKSILNLLI